VKGYEIVNVEVQEIALELISPSPYQPRREFAPEAMTELADSIRQTGVFQPVVVRPVKPFDRPWEPAYELVMGERRLRACRIAGRRTIPAIVREMTDEEARRECVAENLLRVQLKPMEKALAFKELLDLGLTRAQISTRLSVSLQDVEFHCRLLQLRPEYQDLVAHGILPAPQAADMARLPHEDQPRVFRVVKAGKDPNEVTRLVTAILEARAQGQLVPDEEAARSAGDKLHHTLKTVAAAVGRCTSRETLTLLGWVTDGDVQRNLVLATLCSKELEKIETALKQARARSAASALGAGTADALLSTDGTR